MKANMLQKVKFKKLQRRLGLSLPATIGTLELLWNTTIENTPEGDIGRLDDETIAIECGWDDDPKKLVDALLECGWIDECDRHRYVVHDWCEHCPNYIKGNLTRHGKQFAKVTKQGPIADCSSKLLSRPPEPTKEPPESTKEPTIVSCSEDATIKSSLVKSSQVKSSHHSDCAKQPPASDVKENPGGPADVIEAWNATPGVRPARGAFLSGKRIELYRHAVGHPGWWSDFREALTKFPLKCTDKPGGWKPGIDWILEYDNLLKVLEGQYDWSETKSSQARTVPEDF